MIIMVSLNWVIYQLYSLFLLVRLTMILPISFIVLLLSKVHHFILFIIDLPALQHIVLGKMAFNQSFTTIIESIHLYWLNILVVDLPSLQSIELGEGALCGRDDDSSCSLTMRGIISWLIDWCSLDLPQLTSITSNGYSFFYPRIVIMESLLIELR